MPLKTFASLFGSPTVVVTLLIAAMLGGPFDARADDAQRVVSLIPSTTEMIFALGAGNRLVGVDDYSNHPPEAASLPRVGALGTLSYERIASLRPTHIVTLESLWSPEVIGRLEKTGARQVLCSDASLDAIAACARSVGKALGLESESERLVAGFAARREKVAARIADRARPRVLVVVSVAPMYVAGGTSFLADMLREAGAENVFGDVTQRFPLVGPESVIAARPDVVITLEPGDRERFLGKAAFRNLPAVRNERVLAVDRDVFGRAGPRSFAGLEQLAELLHGTAGESR